MHFFPNKSVKWTDVLLNTALQKAISVTVLCTINAALMQLLHVDWLQSRRDFCCFIFMQNNNMPQEIN